MELRRKSMTKGELVSKISKQTKLTKADSEKALNAFLDITKKSLRRGESVSLVGFGTFSVSRRKAKKGRNPQTGRDIKIPAARVPKFKAGKGLKDAVKG
jgi:DNA-binding protein HU-beta